MDNIFNTLFLAINVLLALTLAVCQFKRWWPLRECDYAFTILAMAIIALLWAGVQGGLLYYYIFDTQTDLEFRMYAREYNRPLVTLTLGLMLANTIASRRNYGQSKHC